MSCASHSKSPALPRPPVVRVRELVAVSLPPPWPMLVALGLCPVLSLPAADALPWAEWVAIHAAPAEPDALALALAARARVDIPSHPLGDVRDAVVAVARTQRPLLVSPGRGRAMSPWSHAPLLLAVEDVLPLHPVPWKGPVRPLPWEPPAELHQEVRRAFKVARTARAHLEQEAREEERHAERVEKLLREVDERLHARLAKELRRVPPKASPPDPLEALTHRYRESQQRILALKAKYSRYPRSPFAMDPVTGLKGYLCPECNTWFSWCPGAKAHECTAPRAADAQGVDS